MLKRIHRAYDPSSNKHCMISLQSLLLTHHMRRWLEGCPTDMSLLIILVLIMNAVKCLLSFGVFSLLFLVPSVVKATQVGGGYNRQFLQNKDLQQYEMYVREPLPYKTLIGGDFLVSSGVEIGMGIVREAHVEHSEVGRFCFMPQLVLRQNDRMQYFVGLGAGFMGGTGEFTKHGLGGPFFLASKLGVRFPLGKDWGVESDYYHQSNAGIYDKNASLNMMQLAIYYSF
ncbi:MAG: acyloxyacyl hydrolase [Pseudomonadota bacterium]